jgi:hypothetical protein
MGDKKSILLNFSEEQWSEVEAYTTEVETLYKRISPSSKVNRSQLIRDLILFGIEEKQKSIGIKLKQ